MISLSRPTVSRSTEDRTPRPRAGRPGRRRGRIIAATSAGLLPNELPDTGSGSKGRRVASRSSRASAGSSRTATLKIRFRSISAWSRPTSSQWARRTRSRSTNSSTVPNEFQASANRATVRRVRFGPLPPIRIGNRRWIGSGRMNAPGARFDQVGEERPRLGPTPTSHVSAAQQREAVELLQRAIVGAGL